MYKWLRSILTKKCTDIPLFWVSFNYDLYTEHGRGGSCMLKAHPIFSKDEHIKKTLNDLVDYIRSNYDVEEF